jgi:hypothetical protein
MLTRSPTPIVCTILTLTLAAHALASGRGLHSKVYVVPVAKPVTIDGNLDDWDLSGQIRSYVIPETADMQSVRTAYMYDDEAIYISGIVRDSSPMMNRHDPKTDPQRAWDADVCQLFYSLDPDLPFPLDYTNDPKAPPAPVATMYLWYFTDRQEPCLALFRGMRFAEPVQPDAHPKGVVPADQFQGAYVKAEDGRGYTFEYRIPWKTLGVKRAPKANDILAASLCVFWSTPDGLHTAGGASWVYDIMSGSGFNFQNARVWGKLMFWPNGNVARELVTEGQPPEKPLPLKFEYDLPADGQVSIQLFDKSNALARTLVAQGDRRAGKNVELWDGLDEQGSPLPPGTYTVRGVFSPKPVKAEVRFSVHNSGNPPWPTDDGRGGWGGDHGMPVAVCALPDGMLLAWTVSEYGWGIIRTDLDGRKRWGSTNAAEHLALADDGKRFFAAGGHSWEGGEVAARVLDLTDSRPLHFGNEQAAILPPEGGTAETNHVTGLAAHGGRLYIAFVKRNLIAVHDQVSGERIALWEVPAPGRLDPRPDGTLVATSDDAIVLIDPQDGKVSPFIKDHLDRPTGVAVAPDGTIYVACAGKQQNISVFDASGKFLRSVGKPGGRPAVGAYDKQGMYQPGGIDMDARGRVWVAETEDFPKRISVWDAQSGQNLLEFFGGSSYFGYGFIDVDKPDEILVHNVLWKIDWKTYKTEPYTTVWRKTAPDMIEPINPDGYSGFARIVTADNGRQYMWGGGQLKSILCRRDGDLFKPFAAMFSVSYGWSLYRGQALPLIDDNKEKFPNGHYFWQDANDDQCVQAEEITPLGSEYGPPVFAWLNKDLSVMLRTGQILKPTKILDNGQPVYDVANAVDSPIRGKGGLPHAYLTKGPDGTVFTSGNRKGPSLIRWSSDGGIVWSYNDIPSWPHSLNLPITGPGRLWGMTNLMGVGGDYFAAMTYFGVNHVFTTDGICVAALLRDGRVGGRGPDEGQPEGQGGQFVKLKIDGADRYFIIHGGQDTRVWEVTGLDTVQRLPERTYEHSQADATLAAEKLEEYRKSAESSQRLVIARGRSALDLAKPVGKAVDSERRFEARAAYDEENLYLRYDVTAAAEMVNAAPDPRLIFKGGNLIDLQLATDPAAPADRKTPAPGDLRLLVTRQNDQPVAVLYRPRVANFSGEPIVLRSPTGQESFDSIEPVEVKLDYRKTATGFTAVVTIPLKTLGFQPQVGQQVRMDLGYIFGNTPGTAAAARAYWKNNSFTANVLNDIPHESRLEPAEWGQALVE